MTERDPLPEGADPEHRGFYTGLRRRMERSLLEKRGLEPTTVELLLLAPDLFVLLTRLSMDPRVPAASRGLIGAALVYFVSPFDVVPEALLGAGGFIDDIVLAAAVLSHALSADLEEVAEEHWSGRQSLRRLLSRILGSAHQVLGAGRLGALRKILVQRGVNVP